jgi:two-component system LytT family sensor kinase
MSLYCHTFCKLNLSMRSFVIIKNSLGKNPILVSMSLFWIIVSGAVFIQIVIAMKLQGRSNEWPITLIVCSGWIFWAFLTPLILKIASNSASEKDHWPKRLLIYFIWSMVFVSVHVFFELSLYNFFLNRQRVVIQLPDYIVYHIHAKFLIFFFMIFIVKAIEYYKRYNTSKLHAEKLNAELSNARLEALKIQLNPHFLFNTHHAIISLMLKNENKKAISMLVRLSDFLRTTLDNDKQLNKLSDEINTMKLYLDIQQIRFGDKLTVKIEVQEHAEKAIVPTFILQPIIENSIIHGIAPFSQPAILVLTCHRLNHTLEIKVSDNGGGINGNEIVEGIGLMNTRKRLQELYGDKAGLQIKQHSVRGTVTKIWIPYTEHNALLHEKN